MSINFKIAGLMALLSLFLASCQEQKTEPLPIVDRIELRLSDTPVKVRHLGRGGDSFFFKLTATKTWSVEIQPVEARSWIRLISTSSGDGQISERTMAVEVLENTSAERRAMLVAKLGNLADTIHIVQQGQTPPPPDLPKDPEDPKDPVEPTLPSGGSEIPEGEHILGGEMSLLEVPRLAGGNHNYFVTHRVSDGTVNYSYEFDIQQGHSRWVAFSFDSKTSELKVRQRSNKFRWDPKMPAEHEINDRLFKGWYPHYGDRSGYDRGHLVASNDRRYSREAEDQTYYYTNMSPQTSEFNQGYWQQLESQVQDWGRNERFRDVLYVAKGGTIATGQCDRASVDVRMVRPRFYWMAIVVKRGLTHRAIGFWLKHDEDYKHRPPLINYAVSIDELEKKTGLDLFHNFEDDLENRIEGEQPQSRHWPGL